MPRRKKFADDSPSLLDVTAKLRSGPCVANTVSKKAVAEEVKVA